MRDVHRRLAYAIDIQMMIVKLFIRDLKRKTKVPYTDGMLRTVFHFKKNCKDSSSSLLSFKYNNNHQSAPLLLLNKEYDVTRLLKFSHVEIPEGWETFSCIINSAEFFLDLLQEAEVRCNDG